MSQSQKKKVTQKDPTDQSEHTGLTRGDLKGQTLIGLYILLCLKEDRIGQYKRQMFESSREGVLFKSGTCSVLVPHSQVPDSYWLLATYCKKNDNGKIQSVCALKKPLF